MHPHRVAAEAHFTTHPGSSYEFINWTPRVIKPAITHEVMHNIFVGDLVSSPRIEDSTHVIQQACLWVGDRQIAKGILDTHTDCWRFFNLIEEVFPTIDTSWHAFLAPETPLQLRINYHPHTVPSPIIIGECSAILRPEYTNSRSADVAITRAATASGAIRITYFHCAAALEQLHSNPSRG